MRDVEHRWGEQDISACEFAKVASYIERHETDVRSLLRKLATSSACTGEIAATIAMLRHAEEKQAEHLSGSSQPQTLAVFLPGNTVLYAMALYAIVPSRLVGNVIVRPGDSSRKVVQGIAELLRPVIPRHISVWEGSRESFKSFVTRASASVFCGSPKAGMSLARKLPLPHVFMFLGGGANPFVVTKSSDVSRAVQYAVLERTTNGGADCLCPDVFLVHESIREHFLGLLSESILALRAGPLDDPETVLSPIANPAALSRTARFLNRFRDNIMQGGRIDPSIGRVEPTIVVRDARSPISAPEFYSPVWNVVTYQNSQELSAWVNGHPLVSRAQGITVFGANPIPFSKAYTLMSHNCGLLDVEDGNVPFGGWCSSSSFVVKRGKRYHRPVLVAKELVQSQKEECDSASWITDFRKRKLPNPIH